MHSPYQAPGIVDENSDEAWKLLGACRDEDPEKFFPLGRAEAYQRDGKRVCLGCLVRDACADWAYAHDERFGIWGGISEYERRRRVKERAGAR